LYNAKNTWEAITYLDTSQADLIFTDVIQPETDGIAFIRLIRSSPAYTSVPIIAVGSGALDDDQLKAEEAGANGFLAKPFGSAELQAAIGPFIPIRKRVEKPQSRKPAA
jgi:CheY-like chemotaxis protein